MAARLSDAEFIERTRGNNRRRAERQRQRLMNEGKTALTVWIPNEVRTALTNTAAERNAKIGDTAAELLAATLKATITPATPAPSPPPVETMLDMFGEPAPPATPAPTDRDALMREIAAMLDKGLLGADIARSLNASGRRTASGKEFQGANVLRDYRAWCKKTGAVDATRNPP